MIFNNFLSSCRNILKNKVFSAINIIGLAAGMAAVLIIFLWVKDELSYEQYNTKKDQVALAYLMVTNGEDSEWEQANYQATTSPAIASELMSRYPEVLLTARAGSLGGTIFSWKEDAVIEPNGLATEPDIFNILTFTFIQGEPKSVLTRPHSIVLTRKLADKYFKGTDPVGKTLLLNNRDIFTVTGVVADMPDNAYRRYDFLVPFTYLEELGYDIRSTEMFYPCFYFTYTLLQKGTNLDTLNAKLSRQIFFSGKEAQGKIGFVNLKDIYLTETGGSTRIYVFIVIAIVILLIACMNYMNLAAANAVGRLKEIFTRKANGAERKQLAAQFFSESFTLSFLALIIGIGIVIWFLPLFNQLTTKHISFSLLDIPTLSAALILLVLTSIIAGIYPALLLSSLKMRGPADLFPQTIGGKRHFQKILLFVQLSITVIFIISSIVIFRQSSFIRNMDPGMNKRNVLYTSLGGSIQSRIPVLKNELLANPDIVTVSSGSNLPNFISVGSFFIWGFPDLPDSRMVYCAVDYDYLKSFDIHLARGRFFSPDFSSDSSDAIVVNETAMKKLRKDIPVDSMFFMSGKNFKLIGVVKDFQHNTPLNVNVEPLCFLLNTNPIWKAFGVSNDFLFVRINPDISDPEKLERVIASINATGKRLSPDYPLDFRFLDTFSYKADRTLTSWRKLVLYSSILAIIITCMGLLALTYLNTSQRIREVGIYKINGATISTIMINFYKSYIFWVVSANIVAWPVSWYMMHRFLEDFANKTTISWWIFPSAGLLSILIILVTITWHVYYVARRNPSEALKYE